MSKRTWDTVDTLDTIETLESTPSTPNKKIKKYFSASNLAELHPKIVQCWDYGKNAVGPDQVSMGTNNKFWFTCEKCSHNFNMSMSKVSVGQWCPYCCHPSKALCSDDTCALCMAKSAGSIPRVVKCWNYVKNELTPRQVTKSSHSKFWFTCDDCAHVFNISMDSVSRGSWCQFCAKRQLCDNTGCEKCFKRSAASDPRTLKCWDYAKNELKPRQVALGSGHKFWFKCDKCTHSFNMRMSDVHSFCWCPFCASKMLCDDTGCATCFARSAASNPRIAQCWDFGKNVLKPHKVFISSNKKFWFKSDTCSHSFTMQISGVGRKTSCPYCRLKLGPDAHTSI